MVSLIVVLLIKKHDSFKAEKPKSECIIISRKAQKEDNVILNTLTMNLSDDDVVDSVFDRKRRRRRKRLRKQDDLLQLKSAE